jgi:hypothetical protein
MNALAEMVLDYYWFVSFCPDDILDPQLSVEVIEDLSYRMENELSPEEKQQLMTAFDDSVLITESGLDGAEVALAFRPRKSGRKRSNSIAFTSKTFTARGCVQRRTVLRPSRRYAA